MTRLYYHKGDTERARQQFKRFEELNKGKVSDVDYAYLYSLIGEKEKALSYLKKIENSDDKIRKSWALASQYARLDMREEAFDWLEISLETQGSILGLAANPDFDRLRSDPRYWQMLEKMNLAEFWRDKLNKAK